MVVLFNEKDCNRIGITRIFAPRNLYVSPYSLDKRFLVPVFCCASLYILFEHASVRIAVGDNKPNKKMERLYRNESGEKRLRN